MNAEDFRRIALGMADAAEGAHMGQFGMVKLTPEQQERFVREHRATFAPENGAWGRQGCTSVRLETADEDTLGEAMTLAWQNTATTRAAGRPRVKAARATRSSRKR